MSLLDTPLAIVDLETTGGDPALDRITEVGIVLVDGDLRVEWSSLVNPGIPIPGNIQRFTGITDDMVRFGLIPFVAILAALTIASVKDFKLRATVGVAALVLVVGLLGLQAKVWGVIMMGASLVLFFFLPYLDRSPVKSIRYRGWMYKWALAVFSVSFLVLGYLGTKSPETIDLFLMKNVYWVQIFTIVYFAFFLLMPWYTTFDKTKPVPERVTQ